MWGTLADVLLILYWKKYDYPWYKVKSLRNFILHEYHAIEMRIIWNTTTEILPELEQMMLKILETEFK